MATLRRVIKLSKAVHCFGIWQKTWRPSSKLQRERPGFLGLGRCGHIIRKTRSGSPVLGTWRCWSSMEGEFLPHSGEPTSSPYTCRGQKLGGCDMRSRPSAYTGILRPSSLLGKVWPIGYKSCAGIYILNIPKGYTMKAWLPGWCCCRACRT